MRRKKDLEELEREIQELKTAIQNRDSIIKGQEDLKNLDLQLRKLQSLRRSQIRHNNQLQETYVLMSKRLERKIKEMESRFNPSSRSIG